MKPASVAVVFGTRPEIIKLAPLVGKLGESVRLVNTGQHYDAELSSLIAGEMILSEADHVLAIGGDSRGQQISNAIDGLLPVIAGSEAVVVQGDTNSALAGALAANSMEIPLFHVESGLRSFDRRMPEEHNRIVVDHLADMCWAPTELNVENLKREAIPDERIERTGNPIVEALHGVVTQDGSAAANLDHLGVEGNFVLATIHRPENVDEPGRLATIFEQLARLQNDVLLPMHPRTVKSVESGSIAMPSNVVVCKPLGYRQFLAAMKAAALVISDSGGIQEEVSILKRPLVVLRRSTERPEVLGTFAQLTDDPETMYEMATGVLARSDEARTELEAIPCPYGDGSATDRMYESLLNWLDDR